MKSRHLSALDRELSRVAMLAALPSDQLLQRNPAVSAWSVAQQVDHVLKVASAVLEGALRGKTPKPPINLIGRAVLLAGRFPRGRAKAPERVHGIEASAEELETSIAKTRALIEEISAAAFEGSRIPLVKHPIFGGLNTSQTLRFLVIHTRHHLRIIEDIRRNEKSRPR